VIFHGSTGSWNRPAGEEPEGHCVGSGKIERGREAILEKICVGCEPPLPERAHRRQDMVVAAAMGVPY